MKFVEVTSTEQLHELFGEIRDSHGSAVQEVQTISRGFATRDDGWSLSGRYAARLYLTTGDRQTMVEVILAEVKRLQFDAAGQLPTSNRSRVFVNPLTSVTEVIFSFNRQVCIQGAGLFYRVVSAIPFRQSYSGDEIPTPARFASGTQVEGNWFECSSCKNVNEQRTSQNYAMCPDCYSILELERVAL